MPFTSKDVRFSLMEVVAKYQPRGKLVMANVKSIETPDDHTAIFRMNKVYAPLFLGLCANNCPIIPKHLYEGTDILKNPHNFSDPVGTGAFKLKEWAKGDHITLVRNDNYRKPGLPYLDRIIFKVIKDATSRSFAFEKGEVDFLDHENCNYADYKKLSLLPNVTASPPFGGPRVALIAFNQRDNKILANLKIRQAIYHAIDRQFISDKARYGLNPPLDSAIPKSLRDFHNPNVKKYEYNPAEANKLLDEAGYPRGADGIRFSVRLTDIAGIHFTEKAHQIIKSMLREVGIDVKLEVLELSLIIDKVFKKYDFDMFTNSYATGGDPSIGIARAYVSTEIRPAPFVNLARYSNPEVDRLFNEGAASMNRKTRAKAYFKAQEILAEELPYIWLFEHAFDTNLVKSNFKNCFQRVYGPRFNEVWWTGER
jgi:peptide/nickel transport system substrate-binding protein